MPDAFTSLAFAFGGPPATGLLRVTADDFQVDEELGFAPDGAGQHVLLRLRKRGINTETLAQQLTRFAQVAPVAVSYAGLKDRHAVTTQWFSVDLAGKPEPDWPALNSDAITVIEAARHGRKLRRGALRGNRFQIIVRDLRGDIDALSNRLQQIKTHGFPNYFGEQRFGRDNGNLLQARVMFEEGRRVHDRHRRGLYLSAARSFLFNKVLSQRVSENTWNQVLPGEALQLDGSGSYFVAPFIDDAIHERLGRFDIHPSGPLWGTGDLPCQDEACVLEQVALAEYGSWCSGLERAGMKQERRALRTTAGDLSWEFLSQDVLCLRFHLMAGQYATALLRELTAFNATTAALD